MLCCLLQTDCVSEIYNLPCGIIWAVSTKKRFLQSEESKLDMIWNAFPWSSPFPKRNISPSMPRSSGLAVTPPVSFEPEGRRWAMACCCINDDGKVRCGFGGEPFDSYVGGCKLDVKEMNSDNFYYNIYTEIELASKKMTVQKGTSLPTTTFRVLYYLERVGGGFTVYLT